MRRVEPPPAPPGGCNSDRQATPAPCRALRRATLLMAAILVSVRAPGAVAKVYQDQVQSMDNWQFLDYFVYDSSGKGKVKWDLLVKAKADGVPTSSTPTCSTCELRYNGALVEKGCDFLKSISKVTSSKNGTTETCVVKDVRGEGDEIPCADWEQKHTINWGSCVNARTSSTKLLFYNDVEGDTSNWRDIYTNRAAPGEWRADKCNCDCLAARAAYSVSIDRGIESMSELPVLKAVKPHFWYVVLADCEAVPTFVGGGGAYLLEAKVKIEFWNEGWEEKSGEEADFCKGDCQFSADMVGYWEISIFLVVMYLAGCIALVAVVRFFLMHDLVHEIHWLLLLSYACYAVAAMLYLVHYSTYRDNGVGDAGCEIFARCFEVVGYLIFINVLLSIARGWTITTSKLSRKTENLFFTAVLVCIYVGLFFGETLRDRALDYYVYDSWAGYMLITMNIFLLIVFLILIHRTYVFEKRVVKRNFYRRFAFIYTVWFLITPILVLIARLVDPHVRAVVLFGFERVIQVLAFMLIPMLQRPKNSFEVYGATDNYDARIPSINRQLRVQPMAIELPRSQGAGSLSGMPPPVNRNMTSDLDEANRRLMALHQVSRQNQGMAAGSEGVTSASAAGSGSRGTGNHLAGVGEGIIEP